MTLSQEFNTTATMTITLKGDKERRLFGLLHREDGPAVEHADGSKEWWVSGQQHREDGPAIERAGGSKEWWVNGICVKYSTSLSEGMI